MKHRADRHLVLGFVADGERHFATDLRRVTGLRSARLFRAIDALRAEGRLVDGWDESFSPARRYYEVVR